MQFAAGYDDEEMGALDCEEIEGYIESSDKRLLKLAEEFEKEKGIGLQLGDQIGKKVIEHCCLLALNTDSAISGK